MQVVPRLKQLVAPYIQEEGVRKGLKTDGIFEGQYKVQLDPRLPYTPAHPGQKWESESEKL